MPKGYTVPKTFITRIRRIEKFIYTLIECICKNLQKHMEEETLEKTEVIINPKDEEECIKKT